jgi:pantoate kinase
MRARAFCPGHISTFFVPRGDDRTPAGERGSLGSGFCIAEGVTAAVSARVTGRATARAELHLKLKVVDNGAAVGRPLLTSYMLSHLLFLAEDSGPARGAIEVRNRYRLPIGAGFGVSGGLALAGALAANRAMGLGLPRAKCVEAAHVAEVVALTGLGDVAGQSVGGFEVRRREGPPPRGQLLRPRTAALPVVLASFGPRPTRAFLRDPEGKRALTAEGRKCLAELLRAPTLAGSTRLGRRFAEKLGLASPRARRLMAALGPTVPCSVAMLGDSVFALGDGATLAKVRAHARGAFVLQTRVEPRGARLL